MTTAVGRDAATTCASFRAGIKRASQLSYFELDGEGDEEPVSLLGFVAETAALEAEGLGKVVALGATALRDLLSQQRSPTGSAEPVGMYLVLPDLAGRLVKDGSEPDAVRSADTFVSSCNAHLRRRLITACGLDLNVGVWDCTFGAQTEYFAALRKAADALAEGKISRCIVGGIDSFIDPDSLTWALSSGRLLTDTNTNGFYPGEAAVFVQLEKGPVAQNAPVASIVLPMQEVHDSGGSVGVNLASAIRAALVAGERETVGLIIGGLNGEFNRSNHWGHAVTRLAGEYPGVVGAPVWSPVEAFGETGCATVGLGIGLGIKAFERGYANTNEILLWALADSGRAGAMLLRRG